LEGATVPPPSKPAIRRKVIFDVHAPHTPSVQQNPTALREILNTEE
jgi:hypothetical protein